MSKQKKNIKSPSVIVTKENPLFNYILIVCFFIFLVLLTTFKISGDDDVFWHLATGRYVVQTHNVPATDIFGFVTQGQQWMPFEWGWDVFTYGIFSLGGYTALSVLRTIILLAVFSVFYLILKKFKVGDTIIFIFFILLSFAIIDRLTPRPHIISYLFFAIVLYILINYRYFHRSNFKQLFFLPLIFLLWGNMHMGIIAGVFLLGIYVLTEIIIFLNKVKYSSKEIPALSKPELIRLLIISFSCILVMLINPNSFETYIYAYNHTQMKMLETVNEWMSPFDSKYSGGFVSNLYKFFLFAGLLNIFYAFKRKDLFPALLYIGFAVYSVRAMRFTVDYVLITFLFTVISISYFTNSIKNESVKDFIFKQPYIKAAIAAILIFLSANIPNNNLYLGYMQYYRISGTGINSDFIPVQLFDFVKANNVNKIGDRPFNHFGTGGYLVWNFPESKNFIDSRNLNDSIFFEYNTIIAKRPGFEKKLLDYNIDYIIFLEPDLIRDPERLIKQTIISYLCRKPEEWKLLFWDDKSFLFVKNIPKFKELIDAYEYRYINPYNFMYQKNVLEKGLSEDRQKLKSEIERKQKEDPNGVVINSFVNYFGNKLNN